MKLSALMQLNHAGMTSYSCSAPPSNIHQKPKALGSVLQARCTEKERLASQGAYSLGGHRENLMRNSKRQCVARAKTKVERQTRGLEREILWKIYSRGDAWKGPWRHTHGNIPRFAHKNLHHLVVDPLTYIITKTREKCPAPGFSYLPL